jgi:prolyl-tRNA editing enzyme YbaK/EbsC (Cys-tRNA(Pro) deacylase)
MNENQTQRQMAASDRQIARLDQLRETLDAAQVDYTLLEHDLTVRSAQEGAERGFGELANMAPTFILRSETGYLAAIIRGDTRLSYKKIRRALKLKDICLATPEQVRQVTGSDVGYVSLLNVGMATIIDSRVTELNTIYGGCGVPCCTLRIAPRDLIALAQAQVFDFAEPKDKAQ